VAEVGRVTYAYTLGALVQGAVARLPPVVAVKVRAFISTVTASMTMDPRPRQFRLLTDWYLSVLKDIQLADGCRTRTITAYFKLWLLCL